jgi:hypothetical protein
MVGERGDEALRLGPLSRERSVIGAWCEPVASVRKAFCSLPEERLVG